MADPADVVALPLSRARQQLVEDAQPFVRKCARHFARLYGYEVDELVGIGNLALTEAARRFDPALETPFVVFAYQRVRGEMLDSAARARRQRRTTSREVAHVYRDLGDQPDPDLTEPQAHAVLAAAADAITAAFALHDLTRADDTPERALDQARTEQLRASSLGRAVSSLDETDRALIELHYFEDVPLKDVATRLAIPYITARRKHVASLSTLAKRMAR